MSEFLRLYEHYRARATIDVDNTLKLATTSKWADLAFKPDTPEYKARLAFCRALHKPFNRIAALSCLVCRAVAPGCLGE
jgi:hypothetical protein